MQIFEVTEGILKGVATPVATYKPVSASPAGFAKNAAEYFAKSILDKAGISPEMQGNYDPTGHVAAGQRKGTASINKQEIELAKGNPKYHAPIQIDTGTSIELRDPKDPTKVLARMPKSQMPLAGQVVETAHVRRPFESGSSWRNRRLWPDRIRAP